MNALSHRKQQKGAVLVLVTIALFTLLGFTALALDGGYLLLNKTRVQDAVDSAALSGAKTLDDGGTHAEAEQAVKNTLSAIFQGEGFSSVSIDMDQLDDPNLLSIQFSDEVNPFTHTNNPDADYIRVALGNVPVTQFFSQLLLDTWQVWASAVAGKSPPIKEELDCQIIPLLMCEGSATGDDKAFGFTPSSATGERGEVLVIKAPNHNQNSVVGPGNFLALDLGETGGGADEFREGLAGNSHDNQCIPADGVSTVNTKTGNMIGPTFAGLNTRFGDYKEPMVEPLYDGSVDINGSDAYYADCEVPDYGGGSDLSLLSFTNTDFDSNSGGSNVLTDTTLLNQLQSYPQYELDDTEMGYNSTAPQTNSCQYNRRLVKVPVADCTGHNPGQSSLTVVGTACMFLVQKVTGDTGNSQFIVAEFVDDCTAEGTGFEDESASSTHRLVLYKDYGSNGGS